jgi:hypothetical protein
MRFKSQFVPWRTAVGAAIVSVLALTLAGFAHGATIGAPVSDPGGSAGPVTAQFDLPK